MDSKTLTNLTLLSGRSMLAVMFIMAGFGKITLTNQHDWNNAIQPLQPEVMS
ncbi:MAG: hypothetical protein GY875_01775 [Gammaproteobacteria bacterium]|nr:hypothetical protein [Gammaproteobacteria bacterium]